MKPSAALIKFLIDEDLSRELATVAIAHGHLALSVRNMVRLRSRHDGAIARFALENEMILVTRNVVDHEKIYINHDKHPGLVFFSVDHPKLNQLHYQKAMCELAIADIEEVEPIQEALAVHASGAPGKVTLTIDRYSLPELVDGWRS